jgi:D-glycero-alpha-D-manno-heptose-7-phosphate kinase
MVSKKQLAMESIHIEQNMIKETVGSQDQVAATYGGLNHIIFNKNKEIEVRPLILPRARREELMSHLMLFYTGIMRTASDVAISYVEDIQNKQKLFEKIHDMVDEGISLLTGTSDICEFGKLLHEAWMIKRGMSSKVSNDVMDSLYECARAKGAIGGKITGAGGGGFLLLFVPPSAHNCVRETLSELLHVPFRFESNGSQIVLYDPSIEDYSDVERDRAGRSLCSFRELYSVKS